MSKSDALRETKCPECGTVTRLESADLGGVDYWPHYCRKCPTCGWESEKEAGEFETGPYHG